MMGAATWKWEISLCFASDPFLVVRFLAASFGVSRPRQGAPRISIRGRNLNARTEGYKH